jgi:hypothetical protein
MQALPLIANQVVCNRCGAVAKIGQWPTGKRAKCSTTRTLIHLPDSATGNKSKATELQFQRTAGHAGYYPQVRGKPLKFRSNP